MTTFIEQPFDPYTGHTIQAPNGLAQALVLKAGQVPVWLSFLPRRPDESPCPKDQPPAEAVFFGAIFDSGHGHTLSVARRHLGLPDSVIDPCLDAGRVLHIMSSHGEVVTVPRLIGDLWIHSTLPAGTSGRPPAIKLPMGLQGVACYPDRVTVRRPDLSEVAVESGPRVPLLGGRPLVEARVDVHLRFSARVGNPPRAIAEFSC